MKPADQEQLREAVARNAGAVLSLPSAGMLRHHKTRLLAGDEDGFWIEAPIGEQALIDEIMAGAKTVGVSLKSGPTKIVFTTSIRQFRAGLVINKDTSVDALLMTWPAELKAVQRRNDYRVTVRQDAEIGVRIWRIPEHHFLKDRPQASTEVKCTLRDLSVGGMAVLFTPKGTETRVVGDQRLRVVISWAHGELTLEGRAKHLRDLPGGGVRLGVQFKKMEGDLEGRQALAALTGIVGQLQRDEIRRRRLGRAG